jgi:hypothetical protein
VQAGEKETRKDGYVWNVCVCVCGRVWMKDDGWRMMDDGWIWELLSLKVDLYRQTDGRTDIQTDKQLPLFITLTDLILDIATDFSHTINTSSTSLISYIVLTLVITANDFTTPRSESQNKLFQNYTYPCTQIKKPFLLHTKTKKNQPPPI